jgi:hypothetical protein
LNSFANIANLSFAKKVEDFYELKKVFCAEKAPLHLYQISRDSVKNYIMLRSGGGNVKQISNWR